MEIGYKPAFLLLIVFMNLTTFGHSRATTLANHDPKRVDSHEPHVKQEDQPMITIADLTHVKPVEHHHGYSGGFHGAQMVKDGQEGALFSNGLNQGSYGGSYGYGYDNPYPGGIFGFPRGIFGFPRGLFGFPRGLFGFPRGIFGFPRGYGLNPGVYGVNPGGYGGYPGGYGGYPGGYNGGQPGDKPGGGVYGGKAKAKGK